MSFPSLPTELTLSIVGYLDPDSTLHFALACKEHATLCKSVLKEHGARFTEWQVIDTTNGNTLLWKKLKELIQYPSLGWYVRELNLPTTRQYSWNPGEHNIQDGPSHREKDLFAREAGKLQGLYPLLEQNYYHKYNYQFHGIANPHDRIGTIQERINSGHEDGIIAIMLHYLPYLHTIRITDVDTNGLELTLYCIAEAYRSPDKSPGLPLKHLKTVTIAHWDTELSCSPDWACYFASIPSVRTIAARAMGNKPHVFIAKQLCSTRSSNVTELFLEQCQMDVNGLVTIFGSIKNLTKFTYTAGGDMVSDMAYEPKRVIKALLEHAADTLEELTLDQEYYGEDMDDETDLPHISLRGFQALKLLDIQWSILRPPAAEDLDYDEPLEQGFFAEEDHKDIDSEWDVRTILPESLEALYVHGDFPGDDGEYEFENIRGVFEKPSPLTPNLSWEKTCIRRLRQGVTRETIGGGERPVALLMQGHGYL